MKTRRSRGLKGGEDTEVNRSNWENFWKKIPIYHQYDPKMNYPGKEKTNRFNLYASPGKSTRNNRSNWEHYWQRSGYPVYKPEMNYPGIEKKRRLGLYPSPYNTVKTPNTYIIQRHGFSCANLAKIKGNFHSRIADPSLTAYGIYSLLRDKPIPKEFDGIVFASSLVRTWQTAILEYGEYGPLTIVVSPYIKEKHGLIGDLSNMPLPLEQQMSKMEEFMDFLKGIDNEISRKIAKQHIIVYNGIRYPLGSYPTQEPLTKDVYIEYLKGKKYLVPEVSESQSLKMKALVPSIPVIPDPSYEKYYGADGFVFFDHWVHQHYPRLRTIFVVSHSNWMQKIIQQYAGNVETPIFDENAWKLTIKPFKRITDMNFEFVITPGIPKPDRTAYFMMNVVQEPTCQLPLRRDLPEPLLTDPREYAEQYSEENDQDDQAELKALMETHSENKEDVPKLVSEEPNPVRPIDETPSQVRPMDDARPPSPVRPPSQVRPMDEAPSQVRPMSEPRERGESLVSEDEPLRPSLNTEATPAVSKITTVPVTNEKTEVITRSYTELVHMLCDRSLATGLNALMASTTDFKAKIVNYIKSNPYVMVSDPTDTSYMYRRKIPIYLFENHYLIFILLCKPYFDLFVNDLETKSDSMVTKQILSLFNISVPIPMMVSFLQQLQQSMHDPEVYHLLLSIFSKNANKHYAFKEGHSLLSQTLLDLLLYELQVFPVTTETIDFMYRSIFDLVRYGARCSAIHYRQRGPISLVELATGIEPPSSVIVPFKMPIVELELLPDENEIFQTWERKKREIDPNGILSTYQQRFTNAKKRLRVEERKVQLLYNKAKYQMANLEKIHDDFLKRNGALFSELEQIKREYRAARAGIDPDNQLLIARKKLHRDFDGIVSSYLNDEFVNRLSDDKMVHKKHNDFFQKFTDPAFADPRVSLGGSKGTSWKKTSLRQSSVKGGRYRALLYKGKRRTRANRK
jgi:hypothetical protein